MKTVFIFDIDSTIADNTARAALLQRQCVVCLHEPMPASDACPSCGSTGSTITQESWDNFLDPETMAKDKPIEKAISVLEKLREHGAEVHFITGRNEKYTGQVTKSWLGQYAGWDPNKELLIMRQEDEFGLAASVYKERAFKRLREQLDDSNCLFVFFEDDSHVFNVYNKYGIVIRCPDSWNHICPSGADGVEAAYAR